MNFDVIIAFVAGLMLSPWVLWPTVFVLLILGSFCVKHEHEFWAGLTFYLSVFLTLSAVWSVSEAIDIAMSFPANILAIAGFLLIGVLVALVKWAQFVRDVATEVKSVLRRYEEKLADSSDRFSKNSPVEISAIIAGELNSLFRMYGLYSSAKFSSSVTDRIYHIDSLSGDDEHSIQIQNTKEFETSPIVFENGVLRVKTVSEIFAFANVNANQKKTLISAWISYWPMVLCSTIIVDLIGELIDLLSRISRGAFNKVTESVIASVK